MSFCINCGNENGNNAFCTSCGHKSEATENSSPLVVKAKAQTVMPTLSTLRESSKIDTTTSGQQNGKKKVVIGASAALFVILLFIVGGATAKHWVKVDVPEHPETFHSETYTTGNYDISDNHVNPCWVGEDWTTCTNSHIDIYNSTCASVPLTSQGSSYCSQYLAMIDDMQSRDRYGLWVATLGSWGYLTAIPESVTKQVSNNDYEPAVTHKATCYFGFIGECEK